MVGTHTTSPSAIEFIANEIPRANVRIRSDGCGVVPSCMASKTLTTPNAVPSMEPMVPITAAIASDRTGNDGGGWRLQT